MMVLRSEVPFRSRLRTSCMLRGESTLVRMVEPGSRTPSWVSSSGRRLGIWMALPAAMAARCAPPRRPPTARPRPLRAPERDRPGPEGRGRRGGPAAPAAGRPGPVGGPACRRAPALPRVLFCGVWFLPCLGVMARGQRCASAASASRGQASTCNGLGGSVCVPVK